MIHKRSYNWFRVVFVLTSNEEHGDVSRYLWSDQARVGNIHSLKDKLCGLTIDWVPATTGKHNDFISMVQKSLPMKLFHMIALLIQKSYVSGFETWWNTFFVFVCYSLYFCSLLFLPSTSINIRDPNTDSFNRFLTIIMSFILLSSVDFSIDLFTTNSKHSRWKKVTFLEDVEKINDWETLAVLNIKLQQKNGHVNTL